MSLFQPVPDMQTMYPQGAPGTPREMPMQPAPMGALPSDGGMLPPSEPQQGAEMPVAGMPQGNFEAPLGGQGIPTYVGNPMIDKYIHMFVGA